MTAILRGSPAAHSQSQHQASVIRCQ